MIRSLLCLVVLVGVSGCGGAGGPSVKVAPVSGVVLVDGKPVEKPIVTFYPEVGPAGIGVGNEKGEFSVKTNGRKGAPVGKCKVTVVGGNEKPGEFPPADGNEMKLLKKATLNKKYASLDTTDLVIEIPEGGDENLQLDLDS